MHKKILIYLIVMVSLAPFTALAAPLETLQVTSLNDTPTVSSTVLENGKVYEVDVQGTYTFSSGDRIADAEFSFNPDTAQWYEELQGVPNQQFILDLLINGFPVDWLGSSDGNTFSPHTYSPDHHYKLMVTGQEQPISFTINDSSYDWNSGYLTVTINSSSPSNAEACKKEGWKAFSIASFENQGECIKYTKLYSN